jgi:hypothetical protein
MNVRTLNPADQIGQELQREIPLSFPAIMAQAFAQGSGVITTAATATFNAPSNTDRLLGFTVNCNTNVSQDASWLAGVLVTVTINQDTVCQGIPLEFFYQSRNRSYGLPFVPLSRRIKVGDNVQFAMSTSAANQNVIVSAFYQKSDTPLI